ncbi:methyltransferase family protein [Palleronia sp.]|uniref:methyltransferase family protein n=1 Tax=Palleronia sp. TaxID=1940284 RepID=UPI0035C7CFC6
MRWLDLPPVWTVGHLVVLWLLPQWGGGAGRIWDVMGVALISAAVVLMVWAVATMLARRTPVMPGQVPEALVTGGPFVLSRNPIYLGDVLLLAGAALWWGPIWGIVLVVPLMTVLTLRFILPEEARLRHRFGEEYEGWARRVRRWV